MHKPFWTFIFIILCIVIFFIGFFIPTDDYSFVPSKAFFQPWIFITSIFLHADFSHLFFNMFALFIFGIYLESKIGRERFFLIFFISGIAGSFGYMLTALNPNMPAVGASGAIYGIIGTLAILTPFAIVYVGYMPMPMILAAFLWGLTEFLGLFVPSNIARGSHLAGLFVGILAGFYIRRMKLKYRI